VKLFISLGLFCLAATVGHASEIFVNGGFETGDLTGWLTSTSSDGGFYATSDTATPLNGYPTAGSSNGTFYAVSDGFGAGTRALTQLFTYPLGSVAARLSFDIFVNDQFGNGGSPQFVEVDLLANGADPITGTALAVFYGPTDILVSGGNPNPYVYVYSDITSALTPGGTYLIRVLEADSTGPLQAGVDNFSLMAYTQIPEPSTFQLVGLTGVVFAVVFFRRRDLSRRT
jgi:hypothetical protein